MLEPILKIQNLNTGYNAAHILHDLMLDVGAGIHALLGRNGMGKTTLCETIMGLMPTWSGQISMHNKTLTGLPPHKIARAGIGYVPQGRRLWPSLTVDEHLRMGEVRGSSWTIDRVYETFPRLAERKNNGGGQMSGGEQQMLAIARALLSDPKVLILDEPTEGLSPTMVDQVCVVLDNIQCDDEVAILLVEQNLNVAMNLASDLAIMVGGEIALTSSVEDFRNDKETQKRLLGVSGT